MSGERSNSVNGAGDAGIGGATDAGIGGGDDGAIGGGGDAALQRSLREGEKAPAEGGGGTTDSLPNISCLPR